MEKPPRQLEVPFHSGQQSTSADHGSCAEFEWTEAEEKRVVRKYETLRKQVSKQVKMLTNVQNRFACDASLNSCLHGSST